MNTDRIIAHLKYLRPEGIDVAVVLGSGLGRFAESMDAVQRIPASDIPGYPASDVLGHEGALYFGTVGTKRVLAWSGRLHMYEGHGFEAAALPALVAKALGARLLLATNAAGGISHTLKAGDFMLIRDYLVPPVVMQAFGGYLHHAYDGRPVLHAAPSQPAVDALKHAAEAQGESLHEGVYHYVLGPSYETRAEIRMLAAVGADAVGMSTVPELIAAANLNLPWAAISCITNTLHGHLHPHAGHASALHHEDVARVADENGERLARILRAGIANM